MIFSDEGGDSATLLVDILSDYKGSYAVLEKAMNEVRDPISFNLSANHVYFQVLKQCENVGRKFRFGKTIDDLVARLIDATEQIEFDSLSHVKAICLIAGSDPSQVDTRKASVLLTYLRPPANVGCLQMPFEICILTPTRRMIKRRMSFFFAFSRGASLGCLVQLRLLPWISPSLLCQ